MDYINNILQAADPISQLLGPWSSELDIWSILLRIAVSVLFAAIIGWERSTKRHAAGLRTFMIVSLSGTASMLLDQFVMKALGIRSIN